jgi:nucleotide-binding universal stress UspA family protein
VRPGARSRRSRTSKEILEETGADAKTNGIQAEFPVRLGDPATEIGRAANEFKVDVVVVGASMQDHYPLIGSAARCLVHIVLWPVIAVL